MPSEDSKYGLLENATCKTNWLETLYEYTLTCYVFVMYLSCICSQERNLENNL